MAFARRISLLLLPLLCGLTASARFEADPTHQTLERVANNAFGTPDSLSSQAELLGSLLEKRANEVAQKGIKHLKAGQIAKAKELLSQAVAEEPKQVDAWLALLYIELSQDELIAAQHVATKTLELFPHHPEVRAYIGLLAAASGHEAKAIAFLEDTLQEQPDALMPALHLANLYVQQKQPQRAIPLFEHLLTKYSRDAGLYRALALLWIKMEKLPNAESTLRKALVQSKDTIETKLLLGRVILKLNRPDEAASWLEQIPVGHPQYRLSVHFLSEAYLTDRDLNAATRLLQHWLDQHPDDTVFRYRLAFIHQANNAPDLAAKQLRLLLTRAPKHAPALNDLASLLCESPATREEAARLATQALALAPKNPAVLDTAGWVAWLQNDHTTARTHLEAALTQLPNHPHIQLHLAITLATTPGASTAR